MSDNFWVSKNKEGRLQLGFYGNNASKIYFDTLKDLRSKKVNTASDEASHVIILKWLKYGIKQK